MFDMLLLTFQTTRRASHVPAGQRRKQSAVPRTSASPRVTTMTHHFNNRTRSRRSAKIDYFYAQQFARSSRRWTSRGRGWQFICCTTRDHLRLRNSDGNPHTHVNLPLILPAPAVVLESWPLRAIRRQADDPTCFLAWRAHGVPKMGSLRDSDGRLPRCERPQ